MTVLWGFLLYAVGLNVALYLAGHRGRRPRAAGASSGRVRRVLVIGATGGTGRELVTEALARGLEVTALIRRPEKLAIQHPRLTVMRGDVLDRLAVDEAMRDQDAVLCALGHKVFHRPTRILSRGTANIVAAMQRQGTRRLVCETALGIGDSAGRLGLFYSLGIIPLVLPFYFWDKTRQERVVADSDLDWVIVRPGVLGHGPREPRDRHGRGVGSFLWSVGIPRVNVAAFMLDQLESDQYLGAAPGLTRG